MTFAPLEKQLFFCFLSFCPWLFFIILEARSHAALLLTLTDSVEEHQMMGTKKRKKGSTDSIPHSKDEQMKAPTWMQTFTSHGLFRIVSG